MECKRKLFRIPFQQLLGDITQSLQWVQPVYSRSDPLGNVASVVVHPKDESPLAYYFEGESTHPLAGPEDLAAEKAVLFLVENRRVLVLDFNLQKRGKNEACLGYYKAKKEKLSLPPRKRKLAVGGDYNGVVSIDFSAVLGDVLREYCVTVTAIEYMELSVARIRCFFAIQHTGLKMEWVMSSSCSTRILARQSLARKALKYLQPLLGFEVEDLNYQKMCMAGLQCSLERESYLDVKERATGVKGGDGGTALAIVGECRTPDHEEAMIRVLQSPPPAPKKKRRAALCETENSRSVGDVGCLYHLPDNLNTIFTITGRM